MTTYDLARRVARRIPGARRTYRYVRSLQGRYNALIRTVPVNGLTLQLEEELETLRLQLYVAQSDLQRAISHNDALRTDVHRLTGEEDALRADLQRLTSENDALRTDLQLLTNENDALRGDVHRLTNQSGTPQSDDQEQTAERAAAVEASVPAPELLAAPAALKLMQDQEQSNSRLLARMYLLGADVTELRRLILANGNADARATSLRASYLDLLEGGLTGRLFEDPSIAWWAQGYDPEVRAIGRDWPAHACTMIGTARMRNLRMLAESVLEDGIGGDFLEAGVWRGGACIYMRGILAACGVTDRKVLVADSFAGLPPPNPDLYPADMGDAHHTFEQLKVSLDQVKGNFARYGLLDDQVVFLPGWFKDTLPSAPTKKLALLRLDGDMYSSTIETLECIYYKLAPGGYLIVDDYILPACRQAVHDFRQRYGVSEPIQEIDGAGVFWRKEA